ncbi:MAG: 4Fe-4S binding protein [Prevotellaceae bacterium]|jgi:polyferredoxin|nr:4Fe-4S binding protein [Prevotellaceae bacterium]
MNRFPKPDFESGYVYPQQQFVIPNEVLWSYIDIAVLVFLMGFVTWALIKKQIRWPVVLTSVVSIFYFGFFRNGCVCGIGAVQNVVLTLVSDSYSIPLYLLLLFTLPLVFAIFFGRVFCAGVCPFGALQELVNVKNWKISKSVSTVLGVFPWVYLGFAVLFAVTNSRFIICRFDPFVWIFRFGGELPLILFGVLLLIFSVFTGRPFCRFICPYGAILSLFSKISFRQVKITKKECINCSLCHNACPVDAIYPPYQNKVNEIRSKGVHRILRYVVFMPLMVAAGVTIMYMLSDKISRVNNDVRLYDMAMGNETNHSNVLSLELEAFWGREQTLEELAVRVEEVQKGFRIWSIIIGAFFGLVIALKLIHLSTKRGRKVYDISSAECVGCGRCFSYCPQNQKKIS